MTTLTLTSESITPVDEATYSKDVANVDPATALVGTLKASSGTVTISADEDATAALVGVYFSSDGSTFNSVTHTGSAFPYTFSLGTTSGDYRILFSAEDDNGDTQYFSAGITYTYDSSSSTTPVRPEDAEIEDGEIADGQVIDTQFNNSSAIASFFNSATSSTPTFSSTTFNSIPSLKALIDAGFDVGNAIKGYKAMAFTLPSGVSITSDTPFFVLLKQGTTYVVGIGVLQAADAATGYIPVIFNKLKDPKDTTYYMSFDAGNYNVGVTDDTTASSSSVEATLVLKTAAGSINLASDSEIPLQGQDTDGTSEEITTTGGSNKGSSSGCDAGFGALALLAIVPFIKKIRK